MAQADRRGESALGKTGYFRMTQGEHEAMRSAAKEAGMSFSAYVRQRLGLDMPETQTRDRNRGPSNCFCGIPIAEANSLCPERDCPYHR